jgi:hypothetical protein
LLVRMSVVRRKLGIGAVDLLVIQVRPVDPGLRLSGTSLAGTPPKN